jgi:hypothetical protein
MPAPKRSRRPRRCSSLPSSYSHEPLTTAGRGRRRTAPSITLAGARRPVEGRNPRGKSRATALKYQGEPGPGRAGLASRRGRRRRLEQLAPRRCWPRRRRARWSTLPRFEALYEAARRLTSSTRALAGWAGQVPRGGETLEVPVRGTATACTSRPAGRVHTVMPSRHPAVRSPRDDPPRVEEHAGTPALQPTRAASPSDRGRPDRPSGKVRTCLAPRLLHATASAHRRPGSRSSRRRSSCRSFGGSPTSVASISAGSPPAFWRWARPLAGRRLNRTTSASRGRRRSPA